MSMIKSVNMRCDKCGKLRTVGEITISEGARDHRARAKHDGWKLGKQKDFCKSCAEQIKEAVKQAASGNLS